jgi:hypothetical protein
MLRHFRHPEQKRPSENLTTLTHIIEVSFCDEVWKSIKMSHLMADNSAVSKDRAVRFAWLERAFRAAHSTNVGFSTYGYSPVLQRLKFDFRR